MPVLARLSALLRVLSSSRAALIAAALTLAVTQSKVADASTSGVVISAVYGRGGNTGATYTNDYIELFNAGTAPVSLNGWSVQYASATGTTWASHRWWTSSVTDRECLRGNGRCASALEYDRRLSRRCRLHRQ
jgi:predicted extracellular nuclease